MKTVIVMPCLNEEELLETTCSSLGFGLGKLGSLENIHLILVDNGSDDNTLGIMEHVKERSPPDSVQIVRETDRGYVSARHAGASAARELAREHKTPEDQLLIVQADADTHYYEGYIAEMRRAARGQKDFVLRGSSLYSPDTRRSQSKFIALLERIDRPVQKFFVDDTHDVIVSDNVCAYTLANYFGWGGHVREYNQFGEEIYAETSRLLIKALLLGAHLLRSPKAIAYHSRRKIISDPLLELASAGFPREHSWREAFRRKCGRVTSINDLSRDGIETEIEYPIFLRHSHSLILFGLLPRSVAVQTHGMQLQYVSDRDFRSLLEPLLKFTRNDILSNTARLFEAGFSLIESRPDAFKRCLATALDEPDLRFTNI